MRGACTVFFTPGPNRFALQSFATASPTCRSHTRRFFCLDSVNVHGILELIEQRELSPRSQDLRELFFSSVVCLNSEGS